MRLKIAVILSNDENPKEDRWMWVSPSTCTLLWLCLSELRSLVWVGTQITFALTVCLEGQQRVLPFRHPAWLRVFNIQKSHRRWWRPLHMGTAEPPHIVKTLFLSRDVSSEKTSTCQPWYLNLPLYRFTMFLLVRFKLFQVIAVVETWNLECAMRILLFLKNNFLWFDPEPLWLTLHAI